MWEEAEEAGRNTRQLGAPQALGRANPLGVLGPAKERCAAVSATPQLSHGALCKLSVISAKSEACNPGKPGTQ